jgi:hypothetical protein
VAGHNTAWRAEALVRQLMEDAAADAGLAPEGPEPRVTIADLAPVDARLPETAPQNAMNMA